jgi:hypothetical protein
MSHIFFNSTSYKGVTFAVQSVETNASMRRRFLVLKVLFIVVIVASLVPLTKRKAEDVTTGADGYNTEIIAGYSHFLDVRG